MYWKKSHDQADFKESEFLQKSWRKELLKTDNMENFERKKKPRGISKDKKQEIIEKLCPHMMPNRRDFWYNLPENNESMDLISGRDDSEIAT